MRCKWTTPRDLKTYVHGGLFFYKKEPVWAHYREVDGSLMLLDLTKAKKLQSISPDDPDFDVGTPKLGYFEFNNQLFEVQKVPTRQYNKGITDYNLGVWNVNGVRDTNFYIGNLWNQKSIDRLLRGDFGVYKSEVFDRLKDSPILVYSHDVAFQKLAVGIILVYYKGSNIGYILPDEKTIKMPPDGSLWVIERLFPELNIDIE